MIDTDVMRLEYMGMYIWAWYWFLYIYIYILTREIRGSRECIFLCIPCRCKLHECIIYMFFNCYFACSLTSSLTLGFFNVALYPWATAN
jgi:hypothetical protein